MTRHVNVEQPGGPLDNEARPPPRRQRPLPVHYTPPPLTRS